jgi:hypothetical protein
MALIATAGLMRPRARIAAARLTPADGADRGRWADTAEGVGLTLRIALITAAGLMWPPGWCGRRADVAAWPTRPMALIASAGRHGRWL